MEREELLCRLSCLYWHHDPMGTIQDLADVCPENYHFAKVIRGLERFCEDGSRLDWPESRQRQGDLLNQFVESEPDLQGEELAKRISGQSYEVGGDEHHLVYLADDPERIYKITHSDCFGCRPVFFAMTRK